MKINAKQKCPIKGAANRQLKKKKTKRVNIIEVKKRGSFKSEGDKS